MKDVYLIGDIHGKWSQLYDVVKEYGISDCILICVGDLGIGFRHPYKEARIHANINEFFKQRNMQFLSIRGNHDDPSYFQGDSSDPWIYVYYSNFRLLPDYHSEIINNEKWLFVGGATSIDRKDRKLNASYWENEKFVFDPIQAINADVLVTHTAPTWSGPSIKSGLVMSYAENDHLLINELDQERRDMDKLYNWVKPKTHYAGHFHKYNFTEMNGSTSRILSELQIVLHR